MEEGSERSSPAKAKDQVQDAGGINMVMSETATPIFSAKLSAAAVPLASVSQTAMTATSSGVVLPQSSGTAVQNDTSEKTQTTRITKLTLEMTKADAPSFKAAIQYFEDGLEVFWQYITLMDKNIKRHVKDVEGMLSIYLIQCVFCVETQ